MVRVSDQRKNILCSPVVDLKVRDVFFLCLDTVPAFLKRWKNIRTVYRRAIEAGASGSAASTLTAYQWYIIKRLNFIAPFTKGAMTVVSSLEEDLVRSLISSL